MSTTEFPATAADSLATAATDLAATLHRMATASAPKQPQPESAPRAALVAATARMAADEGLETELDFLRLHLIGIELAVRGLDEADGFSPRSLLPIVQSAQDRCAGIIASLGFRAD